MECKSSWAWLLAVVMLGVHQPAYTCLLPRYKIIFGGARAPTQPALEIQPDSRVIVYRRVRAGHEGEMQHWIDSLDNFIRPYEGRREVIANVKARSCSEKWLPKEEEVCRFEDSWLTDKCQRHSNWGYERDTPCVLLMPSKMTGWVPEVYETLEELPAEMPESLRNHIENKTDSSTGLLPKMVWVSCDGEYPADKENIGPVQYSPWQGFPSYYFPYNNAPGYLSPLVAIQFNRPMTNIAISIECRAWAKNIHYDPQDGSGLLHFQLLID